MKWGIAAAVAACAAIGLAVLVAGRDGTQPSEAADPAALVADVGPAEEIGELARLERSLRVRGDSRRLARIALSPGRTLQVRIADTEDGKACLINEDSEVGVSATCLEGGLFAARPVAFSVESDGGPERFRELFVTGVAAPDIASIVVSKTNGTRTRTRVGAAGEFVVRSTPAELARDVLPVDLRLYAADGGLVEVVRIPALR